MSHVAKVNLEVKDLDALEKACQSLGLELVRNQKTYRWFGRSVGDYPLPQGIQASDLGKCEHAIRIPGNQQAYEIGVTPRRDGKPGYTLLWDFWNGGFGMQEKVGHSGDKLKQSYATQLVVKKYVQKGFALTQEIKEDGRIFVNAVRY